jgi:hypothetical protein
VEAQRRLTSVPKVGSQARRCRWLWLQYQLGPGGRRRSGHHAERDAISSRCRGLVLPKRA